MARSLARGAACGLLACLAAAPIAAAQAPQTPEELIKALNGRGVRYSQRVKILDSLAARGAAALPSLRAAILEPTRAQRKRREDLVGVLVRINSPEVLDILRRASGFTLLRPEEVRDPAGLLAAIGRLEGAPKGSPQRYLWDLLGGYVRGAARTAAGDPPPKDEALAALARGVVTAMRRLQRNPLVYRPELFEGVDLERSGLLAGFEGAAASERVEDSVGLAIRYALNRRIYEVLLPGQLERVELLPTLTPKLIKAAYEGLVDLAVRGAPGAKELLLESDHVPRLARVAGLSRLPGFGTVRILVDQLVSADERTSTSAVLGLRPWLNEGTRRQSVVGALSFKRSEVGPLAESCPQAAQNYFQVCALAGPSGVDLFGEALGGREPVLRAQAAAFLCERPELFVSANVQYGLEVCFSEGLSGGERARLYGALGRSGNEAFGVPFLVQHLEDPDPKAQRAVFEALVRLTGQNLDRTAAAWRAWWLEHRADFTR